MFFKYGVRWGPDTNAFSCLGDPSHDSVTAATNAAALLAAPDRGPNGAAGHHVARRPAGNRMLPPTRVRMGCCPLPPPALLRARAGRVFGTLTQPRPLQPRMPLLAAAHRGPNELLAIMPPAGPPAIECLHPRGCGWVAACCRPRLSFARHDDLRWRPQPRPISSVPIPAATASPDKPGTDRAGSTPYR